MFLFGFSSGYSTAAKERVAVQFGISIVNHTKACCSCGYNCRPHCCRKSATHWFEAVNYGEPHNNNLAREVLAAVQGRNEV